MTSGNNCPYQQAAVVCIRHSKEATTGRQTIHREKKNRLRDVNKQQIASGFHFHSLSSFENMYRTVLALSAIGVLLAAAEIKKRKRRIRRNCTKWVKTWILQREAQGAFPNLCESCPRKVETLNYSSPPATRHQCSSWSQAAQDELCQYFNGVGAVPFQWDKIQQICL